MATGTFASKATMDTAIVGLNASIAAKAPIVSPAFTGSPTVNGSPIGSGVAIDDTTSSTLTVWSSTKVAAQIQAAKDALINGAPGIMDTFLEVANQLATDESAVSALITTVGTKAPLASPTFTGTVSGITKAMVGLGNNDNTSDINKPISTATTSALALKAPLASPTFTGTVSGVTSTMVGLGNVTNTSDPNKPVSTAQQAALDLKANISSLSTVATSGAMSDLSGQVSVTQAVPGAVLAVAITTSNYNTVLRPTSRTDVVVWWIGSDSTHAPTHALTGDIWDHS